MKIIESYFKETDFYYFKYKSLIINARFIQHISLSDYAWLTTYREGARASLFLLCREI